MVTSDWLYCRKRLANPEIRLLCLPPAGGATSAYFSWPDLFPDGVEVHVAQLPGRERLSKEPLITDWAVLFDGLLHAVSQLMDRPLAIFGHSMGGLIGFEIARALRRQRKMLPAHLFVAARLPPQEPMLPLQQLSDEALVDFLEVNYGGLPAVVRQDTDLLNHFLPIIRADLSILHSYQYAEEPPLDCPLTVFGGQNDPSTTEHQLKNWAKHTSLQFELRMLEGEHFFPQTHRQSLISELVARLQKH